MDIFKRCKVKNCENNSYWKKNGKKGYCSRHYAQIKKYKRILTRTRLDPNEIIDCGNYYEICLYNIKNKEINRTKIDKEDLNKVKNYKWCLDGKKYVYNPTNKILLHHLIMGKPPIGYEVDHRFGNKLDNRKSKLRFATHSQNNMNKKLSKGYYWDKDRNKWTVQIKIKGKVIYLGSFKRENKQLAIQTRKEAEQKYFKEFAYKLDI